MLVRRLARPLLGSMFVLGGLDEVRNPHEKRPAAVGVVQFLQAKSGGALPDDTTTVVRIDGAIKLLAGLALSLGKAPRLAAAALCGSLVPTTLAAHSFWKADDEAERAQQKLEFFKNASMLGGQQQATTESAERVARKTRKALPV